MGLDEGMSRIKKMFLFTFALGILIALTSGTNAAPQTIVKVEPYQNVAGLDQQFTVNITITEVQNLFGLEVKVYWNTSILQLLDTDAMLGVESHPNGVLYGNVFADETNKSGEYRIYGASIGQQTPSFNGSGTIVRLSFNVTSTGSCELAVQATLYSKPPVGEPATQIDHSTQNGYYSPIYIHVSAPDVVVGESVNVSGYVIPPEGGVNVTILYRRLNEFNWLVLGNTRTGNQGNYTIEWKPREEGTYQIRAIAAIQNYQEESAISNVSVKPKSEFWWYIYLVIAIVSAIVIVILVLGARKLKARKAKKS